MALHTEDAPDHPAIESAYAWVRLVAAVLIGTIGGVAMWSVAVALPAVQAEFGVTRGTASLPYTLTMLGLASGGIVMGRLADKRGITTPLVIGALMLGVGYALASMAMDCRLLPPKAAEKEVSCLMPKSLWIASK